MSAKELARIMKVIVVLAVVIPIGIGVVVVVSHKDLHWTDHGAENPLGLKTQRVQGGDWEIAVTSGGGQKASDIRLIVTDNSTGKLLFGAKLSAMDDSDGKFNDTNGNKRIDSGDSILLRDTDKVDAGMKVLFLKGEIILGFVKELPA